MSLANRHTEYFEYMQGSYKIVYYNPTFTSCPFDVMKREIAFGVELWYCIINHDNEDLFIAIDLWHKNSLGLSLPDFICQLIKDGNS